EEEQLALAPQELDEAAARLGAHVLPWRRRLAELDHLPGDGADPLVDEGREQLVLPLEVPVHGALPVAGSLGDPVHGRAHKAALAGAHMAIALSLTRGRSYTFPVLELDRRAIGDSTAIIAALEQRHPQPPLYPAEPSERRRALELEEWFDEELGPYIRRFAFHELRRDPDRFSSVAAATAPAWATRFGRL